MTVVLFVFAVVLAVYGLVDQRDVVVVSGAILAVSAVALNRIGAVLSRQHGRES